MNLLLVESHAPTREYVAGVLRAAGHAVRAADEGHAAWELFAHDSFDAVLLSLAVPPGEALTLVSRLRASAAAAPVLVFDHAHLGQAQGLNAAMRLKPDAYVADVSRRELFDRLGELATRRADGPAAPAALAALLARPAAFQGMLKGGTLPSTLVMLWRTFRDGVLVLQHGETERRVYLRHGRPVNYDSSVRAEGFDRWLVEQGRISEDACREALHERAGGALSPAAALVAVGALEPGEPLLAALREHLRAMLAHAVSLRTGLYRFHAGQEFLAEVQALEVPALAHLLAGARAGFAFRTFAVSLSAEAARYPRRSDEFSALLPDLGLVARDLKLALELNGRRPTAELLAAKRSQLKEFASLLWFLKLAEAVRFEERPVEGGPAAPPAPEERPRALPAEELAQVREASLVILPGSYFRALGVDIACTAEDVERAYHQATERFHPDRFAGFDVAEVQDLLEQILDKLSAAYRVLSDPDKRTAYLDFLLQKQGEGLRGGRGVEAKAEIAVKQAERALRERRAREAVDLLRKATQLNPREPEFHAWLAFAHLLEAEVPPDLRVLAARRAAKKALSLDKGSVRALAALALAELAAGDATEARRQALAALRLDEKQPLAKLALARVNRVP